MKIKEKIQNGWSKVKGTVKTHKSKIIKGGAIVGGTALGLGALGLALSHRGEFDDDGYYDEDGNELILTNPDEIEVEIEEETVEEAE